jgi:hypothetical protein
MTQSDVDVFFRDLESVDEKALDAQLRMAAPQVRTEALMAAGAIPYCEDYCRFRSIIARIPDILEMIPFPPAKKLAKFVRLLIKIADAVCACA